MNPRICVCCGEDIPAGNFMSRNPNICASCSSMADGMEEASLPANLPEKSWEETHEPAEVVRTVPVAH